MASNSGSNLFNVLHDLRVAGKVPEPELRRLIQENFSRLSTLIQSSTLNLVNLPPSKGGIPVGNGKTFIVLPVGTNGQILTVDTSAPQGIAWENLSFSDDLRRLLESMTLGLDDILQLLVDLRIIQVDVNGAFVGIAPELNFISTGNVQLTGQQVGNSIALTISSDLYGAMNQSGINLPAGTPVALGSGGIIQANATDNTKPCVGLLPDSIIVGQQTQYQGNGPLTLPDWTSIVGTTSLTVGGFYALSTTSGLLTLTPDLTAGVGRLLQYVGEGISAQTLKILPMSHATWYIL